MQIVDAEKLDDPTQLPALLDQLPQQPGGRLLAVIGAAAGQVPQAGPRIAVRDLGEQDPPGGVGDQPVRPEAQPTVGVRRREQVPATGALPGGSGVTGRPSTRR